MRTEPQMEGAEAEKDVERRKQQQVAAMATSLVSQALVVLFLVLPNLSLFPSPTATDATSSCPVPALVPFLLQILSASSSSQLSGKKRKHPDEQEEEEEEEEEEEDEEKDGVDGACEVVVARAREDHFRLSFRMSAATFEWLACLLDPLLDCRRGPPGLSALQSPARLAIGLARLASGEPYPDLAHRFGVSIPVARFCAGRLRRVLCTNFRFWLAFPTPLDLPAVSAGFRTLAGGNLLPNCCGAVACARFPRGGESAIAAQVVADSSSRILSIAAGFRGDETDYGVLKRSSLYKDVEAGRLLGADQYLVGDVGHPLLPWLMVPFSNQDGDGGSCEGFNVVHRSVHRPARRVVASLRNWGALGSLTEEDDAKAAVACIGTCAILHNVLLMREDYSAISNVDEDYDEQRPRHESAEDSAADAKAVELRRALAARITAPLTTGH